MNKRYTPKFTRQILKEEDKLIQKILFLPWYLIFVIMLTCLIGIGMMYSAANGSIHPWASRQLIHLSIAFPLMLIISVINIRFYYNMAYIIYFLCLVLLIAVEFFGYKAMGAVRWINIGFLKLQPADIMKIALILALARYFHNVQYHNIGKIHYLLIPLILIFIPVVLIIKQPDLGTAMILLMLSGAILFISGVKLWKFVVSGIIAAISIPFGWNYLHEYQKNRIIIFLNPESDPLGAGYNIMQSKIAIGSAGLFGKGFLKGSQSQLSFLPERQTDFIFTMFAEEWGFIGCIVLLLLYSIIIYLGVKISINCKNHFGRIVSMGIMLLFFIHIFVNIAMVMGLLPVVGAPLPLLSYGGTIMITMFVSFGLLLNIYIHKKTNINSSINSLI